MTTMASSDSNTIDRRWEHHYASRSDFSLQSYFDRTNRQGPQFGETRNTVDLDFIDHIATLPRQDLIWGAGMRLSPSNYIQSQPTVDFAPHRQTDYIHSSFVQDGFELVPERLSLTLGTKLEDNNYSGFEGFAVEGRPAVVTVRGKIQVRDGLFIGEKGRGQLLHREPIVNGSST